RRRAVAAPSAQLRSESEGTAVGAALDAASHPENRDCPCSVASANRIALQRSWPTALLSKETGPWDLDWTAQPLPSGSATPHAGPAAPPLPAWGGVPWQRPELDGSSSRRVLSMAPRPVKLQWAAGGRCHPPRPSMAARTAFPQAAPPE